MVFKTLKKHPESEFQMHHCIPPILAADINTSLYDHTLCSRCSLNYFISQVLTKLYANYKNCINFMDAYDKAHEVLKKANIIREKRHDSMNLKTKQGPIC